MHTTKKRKLFKSIKVDEDLYAKLKKTAGRRGESLNQLINAYHEHFNNVIYIETKWTGKLNKVAGERNETSTTSAKLS